MNEVEFNRLIEKYLQGKATPKQIALLEKWLESMDESTREEWSANDRASLLEKIDQRIDVPKAGRVIAWNTWRKMAAAVSILMIALITAYVIRNNDTRYVALSNGKTRHVILPDGSSVWLKGISRLEYPEKFDDNIRAVYLAGEALFDVTKDAAHPFIITCENVITTVMGTSFNIAEAEGNVEVTVLTGKVSVHQAGDTGKLVLLPTDKAVFNNSTHNFTQTVVTAGEEKKLIDGTTYHTQYPTERNISDLLAILSEHHQVDIQAIEKEWLNCRITMDVSGQSLPETLDMLQKLFDIKYAIKEKSVLIEGGRCR